MRIVFLSHTPANGTFVVGSHHLSRELRRLGHEILHVSTSTSLWHLLTANAPQSRLALRNGLRREWVDADGIHHIVPSVVVPPRLVVGTVLGRLQAKLSLLLLRKSVRVALQAADAVLVDQPTMVDYLDCIGAGSVIYRPTDAHPSGAGMRGEVIALRAAAGVIATGRVVLEALPIKPVRSLVVENGVDHRHFAALRPQEPGSGFVYAGALDRRFDWEFVRCLAQRFPEESVVLAGPAENAPKDLPSNVRLIGPVPYSDLPALLARAAVGLLPFSSDPGNDGRSPMKYYEYLASGLFVLAKNTPELATRNDPGVSLYSGPDERAFESAEALLAAARGSRNGVGVVRSEASSWAAKARVVEGFLQRARPDVA